MYMIQLGRVVIGHSTLERRAPNSRSVTGALEPTTEGAVEVEPTLMPKPQMHPTGRSGPALPANAALLEAKQRKR
jgi:hypothetical protein